jgi:hypothetical protein
MDGRSQVPQTGYSDIIKHDYSVCRSCRLKWETLPDLLWGIPIAFGIIGIILQSLGLCAITLLILIPLTNWLWGNIIDKYKLEERLRKITYSAAPGKKVLSESECRRLLLSGRSQY